MVIFHPVKKPHEQSTSTNKMRFCSGLYYLNLCFLQFLIRMKHSIQDFNTNSISDIGVNHEIGIENLRRHKEL